MQADRESMRPDVVATFDRFVLDLAHRLAARNLTDAPPLSQVAEVRAALLDATAQGIVLLTALDAAARK